MASFELHESTRHVLMRSPQSLKTMQPNYEDVLEGTNRDSRHGRFMDDSVKILIDKTKRLTQYEKSLLKYQGRMSMSLHHGMDSRRDSADLVRYLDHDPMQQTGRANTSFLQPRLPRNFVSALMNRMQLSRETILYLKKDMYGA